MRSANALTPRKNLIGTAVRKLRVAKEPKTTQADLAARLQSAGVVIDQSAIARIEAGTRGVSDIEVAAIAKALRVEIAELFAAIASRSKRP